MSRSRRFDHLLGALLKSGSVPHIHIAPEVAGHDAARPSDARLPSGRMGVASQLGSPDKDQHVSRRDEQLTLDFGPSFAPQHP